MTEKHSNLINHVIALPPQRRRQHLGRQLKRHSRLSRRRRSEFLWPHGR